MEENIRRYNFLRKQLNLNPITIGNTFINDFKEASPTPSDSPSQVFEKAGKADRFFAKYGIGILLYDVNNDVIHKPFERLQAYELLFDILYEINKEQFSKIHKGSPYDLMGWLAFNLEDYEKGIFYLESAFQEDRRKSNKSSTLRDLEGNPAVSFLLLNRKQSFIDNGFIFNKLVKLLEETLISFNSEMNCELDLEKLSERFIRKILTTNTAEATSILTSLYSFMLEYQTRIHQLRFRSDETGTMEPFTTHLFKGGIIWESILKLKAKEKTLGRILDEFKSSEDFKQGAPKYPYKKSNGRPQNPNKFTFSMIYTEYKMNLKRKKKDKFFWEKVYFTTAFRIRNTSGHKLGWKKWHNTKTKITNIELYEIFYDQLIKAILWSIYILWIN